MKNYFTFGQNHLDREGYSLQDRYCIIEGDCNEARQKMFDARGAKFAFQYDDESFTPKYFTGGPITLNEVRLK